jgi:hypothetical protein
MQFMSDHNGASPSMPIALGGAGALPFLLLALMVAIPGPFQGSCQFALTAYGAVILSFVGALHWAFAMTSGSLQARQRNLYYLWSVVPALLGWMALLVPLVISLLCLLTGFWLHYLLDRRIVTVVSLPVWYLPLRLALTFTVSLSLMVALAAALV